MLPNSFSLRSSLCIFLHYGSRLIGRKNDDNDLKIFKEKYSLFRFFVYREYKIRVLNLKFLKI